jgi:hypothetical protein
MVMMMTVMMIWTEEEELRGFVVSSFLLPQERDILRMYSYFE